MRKARPEDFKVEDFYFLKIGNMWRFFWSEHPAFWCICGYLFVEYFRPQSIYPVIDILPWAQLFLVGALGFSFLDNKSEFKLSGMHFLFILFVIQTQIGILFAYYPDWSSKNFMNYFQWIVIFFVITRIVTTQTRFYIFLMIFALCMLKISLGTSRSFAMRGFSFTSWGLQGPSGYFTNSGELAILMLVQFALFFYLVRSFWPKSNRFERLMLVIGLVTPVLTIIGASSRGSQLALAGLLLLFYGKHLYKPKVMIGMLVLCIALLYLLPDEQKERFSDMGGDDTSQQRILYWENGMEMIKEHPFTGIGLFNFIPYFTDFYPNDINFTNRRGEKVAELPHNILVQIGTDSGVPALMTYLLIVFNCIRYTKLRNNFAKNTERGLAMGVVGFFIAGQFVTVGYYPFLWITAALTTALRRVFREKV